jgi:cytochrome b561
MSDAPRYDRGTIVLHWLTAALVVVMWLIAQFIDDFQGAGRIYARSSHILLGVVLIGVLAVRLFWRATGGRKLPPATTGLLQTAATAIHYCLYALLIAVVVAGVTNALVRGDNILNLYQLTSIAPGNTALRNNVEDVHGLLANAILILAGLHAAAALVHHFVWKDQVLRRMIPNL